MAPGEGDGITSLQPDTVWLNLRDRFPHPFEEAGCVDYITHALRQPVETSFAIEAAGAAIGGISLHVGTDIERIAAEIGYWIGEDFWGRGIATAAIRLLTAHAFEELELARVFAVPFTANTASCRALKRRAIASRARCGGARSRMAKS
jgi:RimJ/RimL family protein N-acetyltransferase